MIPFRRAYLRVRFAVFFLMCGCVVCSALVVVDFVLPVVTSHVIIHSFDLFNSDLF
jgi:hypothetical protein